MYIYETTFRIFVIQVTGEKCMVLLLQFAIWKKNEIRNGPYLGLIFTLQNQSLYRDFLTNSKSHVNQLLVGCNTHLQSIITFTFNRDLITGKKWCTGY